MFPSAFRKRLLQAVFLATMGMGMALGATPPAGLPVELIPVKFADLGSIAPGDSIVVNTTLTKDKIWILRGFVVVKSGVTLTIEPGTFIQGDATTPGTLIVDRGGYLVAAGTREQPITFSGPTEERGGWGGIVLLGKATTNQGSEDDYDGQPWAIFGGSTDDDSSGVLTYVRLDGPGLALEPDRELDGIALCGVGSRTVMHHVQVHRADDDGFTWYGGSVNADHLIVTQQTDDGFDIDHGYRGAIEFMINIQRAEPGRSRPNYFETVGDNAIECGSSHFELTPRSSPRFSHITLIDNGKASGPFQAKEDCGGRFEKMILVGGGAHRDTASLWGIQLVGVETVDNLLAPTPRLDFKDVFLTGKWNLSAHVTNIFGDPNKIDSATGLLNAKIRQYPFATIHSYGLNMDLSPSHPDIIAARAGAIVDNDLWYQDWVFPGTVDFPLGDSVAPVIASVETKVRKDRSLISYCPANGGWAILQHPFILSQVDLSGQVLWSREVEPKWEGAHVRPALAGGFAVAAISPYGITPRRLLLARLDSAGAILFQKEFDPFPAGSLMDFVQAPDSGFLLSVHTTLINEEQVRLIKLDKQGNFQWDQEFKWYQVRAHSVKALSDGGFVVSGTLRRQDASPYSAVMLKLDAAGSTQWIQEYSGHGYAVGYDADSTADGGYLLAGKASDPSGYTRAGLAKVDATGNRLHSQTYLPTDWANVEEKWTGSLALPGGTALLGFRAGGLTVSKTDNQGKLLFELPVNGISDNPGPRLFRTRSGNAGFCYTRPGPSGNPVFCGFLRE